MNMTDLPHSMRQLTARELRKEDAWTWVSPKMGMPLDLIGPLALMQSVDFEFDPDCLAFVPRPRQLEVAGRTIEIDFWCRMRDGTERYILLVPNEEANEATTPRRVHRHAQQLQEAAERAGLALTYVFEHELTRRDAQFRVQRALLGYVQDAIYMPHRQAVVDQLCDYFRAIPRATIDQVCGARPAFRRGDICTGIADLIHRGALALENPRELSRFSLLTWRADYAPA